MGPVEESPRVVACIQARLGSRRLPDKALLKIKDRPVLEWIARRLMRCRNLEGVVVSTTSLAKDDPLVELARAAGVPWFRGSELDLVERLLGTARQSGADALVRITGDCPLVDARLVDRMVEFYWSRRDRVDLVTNVRPPTFPDGLDVEVLPRQTLERLKEEIREPLHREWLTMYLYEHPEAFQIANFQNDRDLSGERWTLDYPEDFEFVRRVYEHFEGREEAFSLEEILRFLQENPDVAGINRHLSEPVTHGLRGRAYGRVKDEAKRGER